MSNEDDEPFCKATDYFYEKMNQGYNKYINSRKMKLKKRIQLIKYLDSFNPIVNYKEYLNKNQKSQNKKALMNPNTKCISSNHKSNTLNNSLNNLKNKSNKSSNLDINLTSPNFNQNLKNSNKINLKTNFNKSYINQKKFSYNNNNTETTKNNDNNYPIYEYQKRYLNKKAHLNSNSFHKNLKDSHLKFPSLLKINKSSNLVTFNNKINNSLNNRKLKLNKSRKIFKPFKYSNNFNQNCILKQILINPDLKLLYDTNESRAKKSVKSQNKLNKKKLSLLKYQSNLIENALIPLNTGEKQKLLESFNKINLTAQNRKKIELNKYLREIQDKEKELIENHNEIEDNYDKNIEKIGFKPNGKRKIHIGRMTFKDIFI